MEGHLEVVQATNFHLLTRQIELNDTQLIIFLVTMLIIFFGYNDTLLVIVKEPSDL